MGTRRNRLHPIGSWLVTALALLAGDRVLEGVFVGGLAPALVAAGVLGLVNMFLRPALFVLTLPITFLTLGLFTFVINALMLSLAAWAVPGFQIHKLHSGIALAVIVAIIHGLASAIWAPPDEDR